MFSLKISVKYIKKNNKDNEAILCALTTLLES